MATFRGQQRRTYLPPARGYTRGELLDEYRAELGHDPGGISRSLLAIPRMTQAPFDSDDAFHDFVGRYREAGINEFIIYWWREDALEYGYDRAIVARSVDRGILERIASEAIPSLRASMRF